MQLTKDQLRVVSLLPKESDGRYGYAASRIVPPSNDNPGFIEGTNGHYLFRRYLDDSVPQEDLPQVCNEPDAPFLLSRDGLDRLQKAAKAVGKCSVAALNGVRLKEIEKKESGERVIVFASGLNGDETTIRNEEPHETYPPTDRVIPKGDPSWSLTLDASFLVDLCRALMEDRRQPPVTIEVYNENTAARLRFGPKETPHADAWIMPLKP